MTQATRSLPRAGLGKGAVAGYLDLDRATANRKEAKDELLPMYAAESLLRLLALDSMAKETFETPEEAAGWMRQPHPLLDGESPLACAKSGFGAQRVQDILVAIKYGGPAYALIALHIERHPFRFDPRLFFA